MYSVNKSPQIGDVSPRTQTTVISTKYEVIRKINTFSKKPCCYNVVKMLDVTPSATQCVKQITKLLICYVAQRA